MMSAYGMLALVALCLVHGVAATGVICGSGQDDSACEHCSPSEPSRCNSKDCKWDASSGTKCVPGNGLATAAAPANTVFYVLLSVTLPYAKSAFDTGKQDNFKKAVASAAGTVAANVAIVSITESRRRAGSVTVETKVRPRAIHDINH